MLCSLPTPSLTAINGDVSFLAFLIGRDLIFCPNENGGSESVRRSVLLEDQPDVDSFPISDSSSSSVLLSITSLYVRFTVLLSVVPVSSLAIEVSLRYSLNILELLSFKAAASCDT